MNIVESGADPEFRNIGQPAENPQSREGGRTDCGRAEKEGEFSPLSIGEAETLGQEILGGASAAHDVLQAYSDMNIVLIRTTGLWGSSFSRAITGHAPDPQTKICRKAIKKAMKSLIFFLPRRRVLIDIEAQPIDLPRQGGPDHSEPLSRTMVQPLRRRDGHDL